MTNHRLSLLAARLLGQVESEIYAGRMDVATAFDYLIQHVAIDADSIDYARERLRQTATDAEAVNQ